MYNSNKKVMIIGSIALIILVAISFGLVSNGKVLVIENSAVLLAMSVCRFNGGGAEVQKG